MKRIDTALPNVCVIEPQLYEDSRGYFMETYSQKAFAEIDIKAAFVQDNQSRTTAKGTVRGIHFQNNPMSQAKLVRAIRGAVWDVVIDLRRGSPTYRRWIGVELSAGNKRMIYIPRGFGHGFLTLEDDTEFAYKVDNPYAKAYDRSIRYNDPAIGVTWGVQRPVLSEKDASAPLLSESDCNFIWDGEEK